MNQFLSESTPETDLLMEHGRSRFFLDAIPQARLTTVEAMLGDVKIYNVCYLDPADIPGGDERVTRLWVFIQIAPKRKDPRNGKLLYYVVREDLGRPILDILVQQYSPTERKEVQGRKDRDYQLARQGLL